MKFPSLITLVFIALIANPVAAFSLNRSDSTQAITAKYIGKVDTIISFKLNVNTEYEQFEERGSDFYYDIRPNISLSTKISFSYRFISFGIGFKPKFIPGNNDNDMQGATKALSFGLNIQTQHWMQDLQFAYVKGFYLHNTADFESGWNKEEDPYLMLPDLKVAVLRGSTGYKFNKNFSLKSISSKTEIQLKSCGSFIPSLTYDYYEIDNQSQDTSQHSSQKSNNIDLFTSFGYIYTFVIKSKFYVSAGLFPGVGFQHTKLLTRFPDGNVTSNYTDHLLQLQEKIGLGYNSKKFYSGAEFYVSQMTHNQNNTSVQTNATRIYFQLFVGYRFNAPKFLKHETDVVKDLAPTQIQKILE